MGGVIFFIGCVVVGLIILFKPSKNVQIQKSGPGSVNIQSGESINIQVRKK